MPLFLPVWLGHFHHYVSMWWCHQLPKVLSFFDSSLPTSSCLIFFLLYSALLVPLYYWFLNCSLKIFSPRVYIYCSMNLTSLKDLNLACFEVKAWLLRRPNNHSFFCVWSIPFTWHLKQNFSEVLSVCCVFLLTLLLALHQPLDFQVLACCIELPLNLSPHPTDTSYRQGC